MVKLKIGDNEYGLRFDMYAMEMCEEEFGSMTEMLQKLGDMNKLKTKDVRTIFRAMANSALAYEGKEETITGKELLQLKPVALAGIGKAVRAAINEGMKSETTGGSEADDEVFDVYLAEIESKN